MTHSAVAPEAPVTAGMSASRLVLWDIDHTLIECGDAARQAYAAAFQKATGQPLTVPWRFDGRTELAAAEEVLRAHSLNPGGALLDTFLDLIVTELRVRADDLAAHGRVLPGALEALIAVEALPGVRQSVLTGNLYPLAILKMTVFGLAGHVDFRLGAYGGDALERADLPRHAFDRVHRRLGTRYCGATTVIIGDTLRDISTAHAVGARSIAVATGTTSADELTAAGADVVLPDLTDTTAVVKAVTGKTAV
ncbi:HAD family hydrolase [Streptomyces sp. NPDC086549]|uniref:HAD family hydrolase n=1 Tax=Streptomyces sp. NPDC086549 TaxID=3365752 RepID=UPI0038105837